MDALSPLSILERGYAVPLDDEGRVLREIGDFDPQDVFSLRVVDGRVRCEVLDIDSLDASKATNDGS
jgi:exodeoxyribonuclease VII large subunit